MVICVSMYAFMCVCVCLVLMKHGMNCVVLYQVGVGVATCNLEYKVMNRVIDIGKIYHFCYGKAFVQCEITM